MNPLFYVAMAVSLGAIAITIYALVSAPEGYEDDKGFHSLDEKSPNVTGGLENQEHGGAHTFYSAQ